MLTSQHPRTGELHGGNGVGALIMSRTGGFRRNGALYVPSPSSTALRPSRRFLLPRRRLSSHRPEDQQPKARSLGGGRPRLLRVPGGEHEAPGAVFSIPRLRCSSALGMSRARSRPATGSKSYGCRKPNEVRLGAGVGGTSSRPARSYVRFALYDGAWLSSA